MAKKSPKTGIWFYSGNRDFAFFSAFTKQIAGGSNNKKTLLQMQQGSFIMLT
jgi:hypothetical protein